MKTYKLTLKHDNGKVNLIVKAETAEQAKQLVMKAENCPESAILKTKEYIKPLTIYEIRDLTSQTSPYFFSKDTLKFFGQTMAGFKVKLMPDGRTRISQVMKNAPSRMETVRFFNPITKTLDFE